MAVVDGYRIDGVENNLEPVQEDTKEYICLLLWGCAEQQASQRLTCRLRQCVWPLEPERWDRVLGILSCREDADPQAAGMSCY